MTAADPRPARQRPHRRVLDARPGRHHHHARRPRRRRHQGRAALGRLHPPDDVADRRGHLADAPPHQPGQARRSCSTCAPTRAGEVFLELVRGADAVIEAMRPGGLDKRGVGYEALPGGEPADRVLHDLRLRHDRALQGHAEPRHRLRRVGRARRSPRSPTTGFCYIPEHPSIGIHAGPLFGALGVLAGITRARATGEGCRLEIAQSDAAAAMDWLRSETWKAYERPESEVTGNKADGYERRAPGHRRHARRRALPVLRDRRRPRPVHGVRAGVLEELLQGHRPARPVRAAPRLAVRRPRPRATPSCARSWPTIFRTPHDGRVGRVRRRGQHADRAGEHAEDARRRPAVPGPPAVDPAGRGSAPTRCPSPIKVVGEELPAARPRPRRVGEHTDAVLARRPRLRRRPHRRAPRPPARSADARPPRPRRLRSTEDGGGAASARGGSASRGCGDQKSPPMSPALARSTRSTRCTRSSRWRPRRLRRRGRVRRLEEEPVVEVGLSSWPSSASAASTPPRRVPDAGAGAGRAWRARPRR